MKFRGIAWIVLLAVLSVSVAGCTPIVTEPEQPTTVYATFYPIFALSAMITDGVPGVELHCLVQPQDGCLRSYTLSDWDIYMTAYSADAVIAGGSGLESFTDMLEAMAETDLILAETLYGLDMYEGTASVDEDGESHLTGANPHLYMSWDGAMSLLSNISGAMCVIDPDSSDRYRTNLESALNDMTAAKEESMSVMEQWRGTPVALMSESLIYVVNDYGLEVVEWIDRESGTTYYDSDLEECVRRISESGAKVVLTERQTPGALITALENAGLCVAALDIMSTGREEEGSGGYLDAMRSNAVVLSEAFRRAQNDSTED